MRSNEREDSAFDTDSFIRNELLPKLRYPPSGPQFTNVNEMYFIPADFLKTNKWCVNCNKNNNNYQSVYIGI